VPVGDDQKQHLELTRDIAQKFNNDFAERIKELGIGVPNPTPSPELPDGYFPLTEPMIEGPATRIMSLRDGTKKMSKSDPSDLSRINLTDDADDHRQEDPQGQDRSGRAAERYRGLEGRPEADNLVGIYAALRSHQGRGAEGFRRQQFSAFKPALADLAVAKLAPMTDEMRRLTSTRRKSTGPQGRCGKGIGHRRPVLKDVRKSSVSWTYAKLQRYAVRQLCIFISASIDDPTWVEIGSPCQIRALQPCPP
jgi:tryptophanyl-tRNA synthetase